MRSYRLNSRLLSTFVCTLALLFVLASFSARPARAQDDEDGRPAALEAGTWALQFSVTLGFFLGSTISGRRYVSADRAWEVGLSLDASVRTRDGGDSDATDRKGTDQQGLGLTVSYLAYPLLGKREEGAIQLVVGGRGA